MQKATNIIIIDPRWHGLGYIDAAVAKGYNVASHFKLKGEPPEAAKQSALDAIASIKVNIE